MGSLFFPSWPPLTALVSLGPLANARAAMALVQATDGALALTDGSAISLLDPSEPHRPAASSNLTVDNGTGERCLAERQCFALPLRDTSGCSDFRVMWRVFASSLRPATPWSANPHWAFWWGMALPASLFINRKAIREPLCTLSLALRRWLPAQGATRDALPRPVSRRGRSACMRIPVSLLTTLFGAAFRPEWPSAWRFFALPLAI